MERKSRKTKKAKERRISFLYILGGGILKEDFITRYLREIGWCVVFIFFIIGNRYSCIQKKKQIFNLQTELQLIRLEALTLSVELDQFSRQSKIEELLKKQNLNLEGANTPPYILYK